jgi:hypothetical protein
MSDLFGFCHDYTCPIFNCKVKLEILRKANSIASKFIFYNKPNAAITAVAANPGANPPVLAVNAQPVNFTRGYMNVESVQVRLPQHILETQSQINFEKNFLGGEEISILYKKRTVDCPVISGRSTQVIELRTVDNPPEFILIAVMDTDVVPDYFVNNGLFTNFIPHITNPFIIWIRKNLSSATFNTI